jgi:hypothetical protein
MTTVPEGLKVLKVEAVMEVLDLLQALDLLEA